MEYTRQANAKAGWRHGAEIRRYPARRVPMRIRNDQGSEAVSIPVWHAIGIWSADLGHEMIHEKGSFPRNINDKQFSPLLGQGLGSLRRINEGLHDPTKETGPEMWSGVIWRCSRSHSLSKTSFERKQLRSYEWWRQKKLPCNFARRVQPGERPMMQLARGFCVGS